MGDNDPATGSLCERVFLLNFMLKAIALFLNSGALYFWVWGVDKGVLPANNMHELTLFYHCIPACQVILCGLILLYLVDEIPKRLTQRAFLIVLFTLHLVSGTVGIQNASDNDFPPEMMVMSILCVAVAGVLVADFIKLEDFFKSGFAENLVPVDSMMHN